jgi:beta-xylosidase
MTGKYKRHNTMQKERGMKVGILFVVFVLCSWSLLACQPVVAATPIVSTALPVNTAAPTNTPLPTATPRATATALPKGILFRDDFDGTLQPGWTLENENPAKWSFTNDGWLQIIGEHDALLKENTQKNLLWYPLPTGDFDITVHLKTKPFENFQQAAIYIYEDSNNYVTINRGYCDVCATGGNGFYMDYKINGQTGDYNAATKAEDVYLRLESKSNTISGYYATTSDQWIRLGRFGNYFQFKKVGIGVSNVRSTDDVIGQFDYFEISQP